jgi:hypothetical protein
LSFAGIATGAKKRYEALPPGSVSVMRFTTGADARRLGTVEHIRLSFIALAAGKAVVVEALAVVMRFNDGETQTATAYRTQHFRGNRARRLLSEHSIPLPADLLGASPKRRFFDADPKSKS